MAALLPVRQCERLAVVSLILLSGLTLPVTPAQALVTTPAQTADIAIKDQTLNAQNSAFITIPDSGNASPSPSTITVSGEPGTITDINVSIVTFTHTAPSDVNLLLVGPHGQQIYLMRFAGGILDADKALLTFDDESGDSIGLNEQIVSGVYKPSDNQFVTSPPLSTFDDTDPNGTWSLYVHDRRALDSGVIELGWAISIQRAPRTAAYPSTIDVAGLPTSVTDLDVTLSGLTHGRASDVDVLLQGPGGQQATLVSDVGGTTAFDATLTLDSDAAPSLSGFTNPSGTYSPTNLDVLADPLSAPAPISDGSSDLSVFDGTNPNGTWRLFVLDDNDAGDFTGSLSGWSLRITTPDPPTPPPLPAVTDTVPPSGSVLVNNGAARTRSLDLTLSSSADGTGSAVTQMRFSNDGTTWSPLEPYSATKAWRLPSAANGARTVYAQFVDAAGNVSGAVSDSIVLDTVRPKVGRTAPAAGASGVAVGRTVAARLTEGAAGRTVSVSSAYLTRLGSTTKVRAVVRYDASRRRITINPRSDLAGATTYRVTISTTVTDLAGNKLDQSTRKGLQPKRWTFTTA